VAGCVSHSPLRVLSSPRHIRIAAAGGVLRLSPPSSRHTLCPSHTGKHIAEAREAEAAAFADLFLARDYPEDSESYIALVGAHERSIQAVLFAEVKYARSTLSGGFIDSSRTDSRRLCLRITDARDAEACAHKALIEAEAALAEDSGYQLSRIFDDVTDIANQRRGQELLDLGARHCLARRVAREAEEVLLLLHYTHMLLLLHESSHTHL
jgi:hypothetical protein